MSIPFYSYTADDFDKGIEMESQHIENIQNQRMVWNKYHSL